MMCETAEITTCAESAMAHEERDHFIAPDEMDVAAVLLTPPELSKYPERVVKAEATALFAEGLRGAMGRSILARDLSISRVHLRHLQVQLDHAVNKLSRGKGDDKRVRLLSDLVSRQHKMMSTSAELLLRLDSVPAATFRVEADQAAFVVGEVSQRGR